MAEENTGAEAPKRDIKTILTIAFVVLNLLCGATGLYLTYAGTLGHEQKSVSNQQLLEEFKEFNKSLTQNPVMYKMETVNTNLTGIPRKMIRLQMSLEMLDAEGFEEVVELGAQARDSIVRIVNSKTFDDIETVQGKLSLKNEIIAEVNHFLERGVVKNVYFTDFVVQ